MQNLVRTVVMVRNSLDCSFSPLACSGTKKSDSFLSSLGSLNCFALTSTQIRAPAAAENPTGQQPLQYQIWLKKIIPGFRNLPLTKHALVQMENIIVKIDLLPYL